MKSPRALAAMDASRDAQEAYRRVKAICDGVEHHIAEHGAVGLVEHCAQYAGEGMTVKTSILMLVNRLLGREARDDVREVLPWL